tara:strand:- start:1021 stop:1686 length:666 start_codon:yes stop_codon:yes gene_type:complete
MPNILAIETSSDACSIAVTNGRKIKSIHSLLPQQHTEKLLESIQDLMQQIALSYQDLDAIAAGCGPGSFTGTRLACSVTQGLAYSIGIPVISVSSMEILALGIHREFSSPNVTVLINAHMDQIYVGKFKFNESRIVSVSEKALDLKNIDSSIFSKSSLFVGDGCKLIERLLKDLGVELFDRYPNAKDLLKEAKIRFSEGLILDPQDLAPIYLSGEEHWSKS